MIGNRSTKALFSPTHGGHHNDQKTCTLKPLEGISPLGVHTSGASGPGQSHTQCTITGMLKVLMMKKCLIGLTAALSRIKQAEVTLLT